jgi:hypothetical protein
MSVGIISLFENPNNFLTIMLQTEKVLKLDLTLQIKPTLLDWAIGNSRMEPHQSIVMLK